MPTKPRNSLNFVIRGTNSRYYVEDKSTELGYRFVNKVEDATPLTRTAALARIKKLRLGTDFLTWQITSVNPIVLAPPDSGPAWVEVKETSLPSTIGRCTRMWTLYTTQGMVTVVTVSKSSDFALAWERTQDWVAERYALTVTNSPLPIAHSLLNNLDGASAIALAPDFVIDLDKS